MLSQKVLLMKLVETIKSHSSKWYKTKDESLSNFYWQDGYAAFSVSPGAVDKVKDYIENQHIHHQKAEYQTEFRKFMRQYKVEYDERYVWD
jgi:REP element-mobilizing transposase RayT